MTPLQAHERAALLQLARDTIDYYLQTGRPPEAEPASGALAERAGAFVTLKRRATGQLRGCIGTFAADLPLARCVRDIAVSSATRDPRFPPVEPAELDGLAIEISVLSPREPLPDPADLEVGTHGICITKGLASGVLLPQVAVEQGWDRETLLDHVCLKAGLAPGTWRDADATLEIFSAEVFGEGEGEGEGDV